MSKPKVARPSYKPTEKDRGMVKAMVGVGVPAEEVAKVLGVARSTLFVHFKQELETAQTYANAKVAECLFRKAVGGNVTAQIFWCKTRMGWSERDQLDVNVKVNLLDSLREANERRAKRIGQTDGLLLEASS